jgi:hypothetical protein
MNVRTVTVVTIHFLETVATPFTALALRLPSGSIMKIAAGE